MKNRPEGADEMAGRAAGDPGRAFLGAFVPFVPASGGEGLKM